MSQQRWPRCNGCTTLRHFVTPAWKSCKTLRLCQQVDPEIIHLATFKTIDELREIAKEIDDGHARASDYVSNLRQFPESDDAFLELLQELHDWIFRAAFPSFAGRFRRRGEVVYFGGDNNSHRLEGAAPDQIETELRQLYNIVRVELDSEQLLNKSGISQLAARFLEKFFRIHPFRDGNGRIGRLMMKLLCESTGRVRMLVLFRETRCRRHYMHALEYAHRHAPDSAAPEKRRIQNPFFGLKRWIGDRLIEISDEDELESSPE